LVDEGWDPGSVPLLEEEEAVNLDALDMDLVGLGEGEEAPLLPPPPLDLSPEESLTRLMRRALYPEDAMDMGRGGVRDGRRGGWESGGDGDGDGDDDDEAGVALGAAPGECESGWDSSSRAAFGKHAQRLLRRRG